VTTWITGALTAPIEAGRGGTVTLAPGGQTVVNASKVFVTTILLSMDPGQFMTLAAQRLMTYSVVG
jgi:hypothetical protein